MKSKTRKLDAARVEAIRAAWKNLHLSQRALAREYGVSQAQISRIISGLSWEQARREAAQQKQGEMPGKIP